MLRALWRCTKLCSVRAARCNGAVGGRGGRSMSHLNLMCSCEALSDPTRVHLPPYGCLTACDIVRGRVPALTRALQLSACSVGECTLGPSGCSARRPVGLLASPRGAVSASACRCVLVLHLSLFSSSVSFCLSACLAIHAVSAPSPTILSVQHASVLASSSLAGAVRHPLRVLVGAALRSLRPHFSCVAC